MSSKLKEKKKMIDSNPAKILPLKCDQEKARSHCKSQKDVQIPSTKQVSSTDNPPLNHPKNLLFGGKLADLRKVGQSYSPNCGKKDFFGCKMKPVDMIGGNRVMVLESYANEVLLVKVKHIDKNGHGNERVASVKDEETDVRTFTSIDMKPFGEFESMGRDGGLHMEKICLNLLPMDVANDSNGLSDSQGEVISRREVVRLGNETVRTMEGMKDVCIANGYQSNLHQKLALLEGKIRKIASEIKETKDMLDKNKYGKSRLVISDIRKKMDAIENGAKLDSVVLSMTEEIKNSLPSIRSSDHEELEARFFPHHKLMRDRLLAGTCSRMNGKKNIDGNLTDENTIAIEFLASLGEKQPAPKNFDANMQFTNGDVNKMQPENTSSSQCDSRSLIKGQQQEVALESNEKLEEIGTPDNNPPLMSCLGTEESTIYQLSEIGRKVSTGGWFVSGGEAVLLAHDDNSCSYYDISNAEVKSEYKAPAGFPNNLWGDCWLIRAPGIDGCSEQYVVAASAGNALESGFCSWDFYTKDVKAFQVAEGKHCQISSSRIAAASMTRSSQQTSSLLESQSCWCKPCGPLLISTSSRQKVVNAYDIRDGDLLMSWEVNSPVAEMEYSSPLQWRNRGKVIIAEREAITLWDVNSLNPQPTLSVPFVGKEIYSLHVNNTDAEIGAGIRQRASCSEVEGNDGVLCTQDGVNVFDFRIPSGLGLKISRHGANALSIFSCGDSILLGSTEEKLTVSSGCPRSHIEHFSLRKGCLVTTYLMPEFNSHHHHSSITQVWGNSNIVMGICGMGLFVFDALNNNGNTHLVKETIGPDDLFRPTFDYMESMVLVISRDRPAFWKYLL